MDQHFLPACYLDQFCGREGYLYKLDCSLLHLNKKPYPLKATPSSICYGKDFYALTDSFKKIYPVFKDYDKNFLEERFHIYERQYSAIINKIKGGVPILEGGEAKTLLYSLIDFKLRNDYLRGKNEQLRREAVIELFHNNPFKADIDKQKQIMETFNLSYGTLQKIYSRMQHEILDDPDFAKHSHIATLMGRETAETNVQQAFVSTMIKYKWKLFISYGEFITSDNPGLSIDNNNQVHNIKFDENFRYIIPITPIHCLIISSDDPDEAYTNEPDKKRLYAGYIEKEMIDRINRLSINHF